jgi:tetratricopeptide (TPR) repeat protein
VAGYFLKLAQSAHLVMHGPRYAEMHKMLSVEHAGIRAALRWALTEHEVDASLRFCVALNDLWQSFPREGEEAAVAAVSIAEGSRPTESFALSLFTAGYFSWCCGKTEAAEQYLTRCLAMNEDLGDVCEPAYIGATNGILAWILFQRGDLEGAAAHHQAELTRARRSGDEWALGMVLDNMANMSALLGDYDRAERLIEQSLQHHRRVGQAWGIAKALADQGALYVRHGERDLALAALDESLTLCRQSNARELLVGVNMSLGLLAMQEAGLAEAALRFRDVYELNAEIGWPADTIALGEILARLMLQIGSPVQALRLSGAAMARRRKLPLLGSPLEKAALEQIVTESRLLLDNASVDAALAEGARAELEAVLPQAVDLALSLTAS